jgi:DNA-binding response OmpR family regulator
MIEILKGKNLLIVEDEAALREPLAAEFESLGCCVLQAKNGVDAFEIVKKENLDLVISDIRMPGGDGVELLKKIKSHNHLCPIVMLITGLSDLSKDEAYHLGAEAILAKPFDLDELDDAVARVLTPREVRWNKPGGEKNIRREIKKTYSALSEAMNKGHMGLGRGGFFLDDHENLTGKDEHISFHIKFESGEMLSIEGTGRVRWVRKEMQNELPAGCGIEFETLPQGIREKVIELVDATHTVPFIPKRSNK